MTYFIYVCKKINKICRSDRVLKAVDILKKSERLTKSKTYISSSFHRKNESQFHQMVHKICFDKKSSAQN